MPSTKSQSSWKSPLQLCAVLVLSQILETQQQGQGERLFPTNEEDYDPMVLDATSIYGSPYGGFSRATRSRLASRPLKLPDQIILDGDPTTTTPTFFEIADGLGRRYACRVFDEDEVEPNSLKDSIFDLPTFRFSVEVEDDQHNGLGERLARVVGSKSDYLLEAAHENEDLLADEKSHRNDRSQDEVTEHVEKSIDNMVEDEFAVLDVERRLELLEGVCIQRRIQYWTYEYCFEEKVQQFHVKVLSKDPLRPRIKMEQVTSLGHFDGRKIVITPDETKVEEGVDCELAQTTEKYRHGDKCPETGRGRKADVRMRCCSESTTRSQRQSTTLLLGMPLDITLAAIMDVWEDPENAGKYIIDICTPILCDEMDPLDLQELIFEYQHEKISSNDGYATTLKPPSKNLEHLSVAEILEETLRDTCLYSKKDGWWHYEYCHKRHVRQFSGTEKYTGINMDDDTQYLLGYYTKEYDTLAASAEWEHVVNVTDGLGLATHRGSSQRGGTGAYIEFEYGDGEMCILEDAKEGGEFEAIERACSVRFSCGQDFSVTVGEDSTCHYVAEVTIPPLCQHAFFKPLVMKKRAFKCLPVEDNFNG